VDAGGGVRLFYRLVGGGRDIVVVVHGGPGFTMDYFVDDRAPMAERHTLLFYDQRGTGRSSLVADSSALGNGA
jgi:proline iminopeptidase